MDEVAGKMVREDPAAAGTGGIERGKIDYVKRNGAVSRDGLRRRSYPPTEHGGGPVARSAPKSAPTVTSVDGHGSTALVRLAVGSAGGVGEHGEA
jgi:hypothetical protein